MVEVQRCCNPTLVRTMDGLVEGKFEVYWKWIHQKLLPTSVGWKSIEGDLSITCNCASGVGSYRSYWLCALTLTGRVSQICDMQILVMETIVMISWYSYIGIVDDCHEFVTKYRRRIILPPHVLVMTKYVFMYARSFDKPKLIWVWQSLVLCGHYWIAS